ncbi:TPA: nucleotide exchange factor GrpE [Candidatus Delongbacteria bacterium]|nr:nucleotide exchange factor GrpE [Candidatus Delongbacteria bacterium]
MTGRSKKYQDEPIDENELDETATSEQEDDTGTGEYTELKEKIAKLEQEAFDYRDKLMRKAAEFENYKKRTSEEFVRLIETANEDLLTTLLPVLDDIERFRKNYNPEIRTEDLNKGIEMIFDKLNLILKNFGLEEIESINKEFNPDFHDALMMMEKEDVASNTVVDQHEKGYKLKNKVIRHAKVVVSK